MGNNKKIFIDGLDGTTGLKIKEKLSQRREISLLEIDPILRKNLEEKKKLMALADVVVLCLPDAIAKESFEIAKSLPTKILDASTAHRTNSNWIYGFPELKGYREKIMQAKYVVNPGCYATAAIALLEPLIRKNLFTGDEALTIHAVSGYSGGGKKLIQKYENNKIIDYSPYALNLKHKHLPEIVKVSGLKTSPLFSPAVVPYYQGLLLQIPLHKNLFKYSSQQIIECYQDYYTEEKLVKVYPSIKPILRDGFIDSRQNKDKEGLEIFCWGEDNLVLACRLDNLGKGASGAAVQNLNLMLGLEEYQGLNF